MKMRKNLSKVASNSLTLKRSNTGNAYRANTKELVLDQFYVIKEIDTSKMPKDIALEQLLEIELLAELESSFIVGYYDSFIEDTKINIIMEYC